MKFRHLLQYLLVKKLRVSNKEALRIIATEGVYVYNELVYTNVEIGITDTVRHKNITLKKGVELQYIAYYKPRGVECTMNLLIPNNLVQHLPMAHNLFHVGRLDKESEGLLLLTNDGTLHDALLRKEHNVNKKYIVTVNEAITPAFLQALRSGIVIMEQLTLPAKVTAIGTYSFSIILTQGLNRQIRRMCYQHQYTVTQLVRIAFAKIELDTLQPNEYKHIQRSQII